MEYFFIIMPGTLTRAEPLLKFTRSRLKLKPIAHIFPFYLIKVCLADASFKLNRFCD